MNMSFKEEFGPLNFDSYTVELQFRQLIYPLDKVPST